MNIKKRGFTLIELLIAIVIIGILSVVGMSTYQGFITKAKKSTAETTAANVVTALQMECSNFATAPQGLTAGGAAHACSGLPAAVLKAYGVASTSIVEPATNPASTIKMRNPGTTAVWDTGMPIPTTITPLAMCACYNPNNGKSVAAVQFSNAAADIGKNGNGAVTASANITTTAPTCDCQ